MAKNIEEKDSDETEETLTPKNSWLWIKDSKGYGSVTLTFATVAFVVTTVTYILSMFESIGKITFRPFDVGACGSYFGTIMALYFGRKWTEAKYKPQDDK